MKRPRKRTLLMVLLLLTGGAIINVAVAWGFVLRWRSTSTSSQRIPDQVVQKIEKALAPSDWVRAAEPPEEFVLTGKVIDNVFGDWPASAESASLGPWNNNPSGVPGVTEGIPRRGIGRLRAGWPMLALQQVAFADSSNQYAYFEFRPRLSIPLIGLTPAQVLPCGPIWPGFAINTIFYAVILWLPFAGFRLARRRVRARRGQCPACGYPVGSSTVCTECGKAVKIRQLAMGNRQ